MSARSAALQDYSALQFWYICLYIGVMPFFIINLVVGVIIEKAQQTCLTCP